MTAAHTSPPTETSVFPRELDRAYPLIVKAEGVRLWDAGGNEYLDAISRRRDGHEPRPRASREIVQAAADQAREVSYLYSQQFTSPAQERARGGALRARAAGLRARALRRRRLGGQRDGAAPGAQLPRRARRAGALARDLAGAGLPRPDGRDAVADRAAEPAAARSTATPPQHLHIPPSTWRFDPSGEAALAALDEVLEQAGPETVSAFFCEPVSAAALPAYSPPDAFWRGLDERRARARLPRLPRRGRDRDGAHGNVVRGRPAAAGARHHHDREGARRRLRADRRDALQRGRLRRRGAAARAPSSWATPGAARRCSARSGSR